jgi:hypothetical protein
MAQAFAKRCWNDSKQHPGETKMNKTRTGLWLLIGMVFACWVAGCSTSTHSHQGNTKESLANVDDENSDSTGSEGKIMTTPLPLQLGQPYTLRLGDNYTARNPNEGSLCSSCPPVRRNTTIFARVVPEADGWLWLDTKAMDPRADTVARIKLTNNRKTCDDDISAADKRSEISRWRVTKGSTYYVTASIKSATTPYPVLMTVELKSTAQDFDPCYNRP